MKVPLSWLRDYVDITLPVPQLVERLTLAGLEVSGVRLVGLAPPEGLHAKSEDAGPVWDRDKIFIAQVLEVNKHPDADRLTLVTLNYGVNEPKVVVTGAPNIKVGQKGQKVIVALSGSVLYDGHAEGKVLKQLKPTKIRGVPSDAMVCSARELGLSDEHEGIIVLEDDAPVGKALADFMGDIVIEVDVLPNMARCLSMIGVAREVAALTSTTLRIPQVSGGRKPAGASPTSQNNVTIEIEDSKLCARYTAAIINNVAPGASPGWMQRRLTLAGMRPISNLVDITNYIMLEGGQPLHAFDYDKLLARAGGKSPTIIVRNARPGETLTTLDGKERKLSPDMLLITDTKGPIAIAGVMGGAETEVSAQTKNVLLESANFNFISIRKTARALDLPSEASYRFSRGIHTELAKHAAERAVELIVQHAGATVASELTDNYPAPILPQNIQLTMAEVRRVLGIDFSIDEAASVLKRLEFQVAKSGNDSLTVITPPHRTDIQHGPADLIEEIVRVHGYDRLPATMMHDRLPSQHTNRALALEEQVRDLLVAAGLQEVMTYSLTTPEKEAPLMPEKPEYIRLANPISSERIVMRQSVLSSVLEIVASNLRHADDVRVFEIGRAYLPKPGEKLPDEPPRLAIAMTGSRDLEFWEEQSKEKKESLGFFDLKGVIETLLIGLAATEVRFVPTEDICLHPGRCAELQVGNKAVGSFGVLHPVVAEKYGLGRRSVLAAELHLDILLAGVPERYRYLPVSEFPPVRQDIAIILDEATPAAKVAEEIRAGGGNLLRDVRLFDLYRGANIPAGKKSLAYALTYQADDKTLTDKEVAKVHGKIVARLEKVLGAQLRG